jgi:NitT/TauT family transport system ATP-binding protein
MDENQIGGRIEVRNVSKTYGRGSFAKTVVLDCSFVIERNRLTVMIGPSGSGKSTMARLLAGFEQPSAGSISFDGKPVTRPSRDRLVLFQETALYPWMTTYNNVTYGPVAQGNSDPSVKQAAKAIIEQVGLKQFQWAYPHELSGGMQRRAELARALINSPAVMILDEPFRGLDAMTKALMEEYYSRLFEKSGRTHFFITTDIDEAIFLADRLFIMSNAPLQVREIIDVDLPRPRRRTDVIENDRANDLKLKALAILHEEAIKSFALGDQKAADLVEAYSRRYSARRD